MSFLKNKPQEGDYVEGEWNGKKYRGFLVDAKLSTSRARACIEIDTEKHPKNGWSRSISGGATVPSTYKSKGSNLYWVLDTEPVFVRSGARTQKNLLPRYKVHTQRMKGSIKVGNVWITTVDRKPKK